MMDHGIHSGFDYYAPLRDIIDNHVHKLATGSHAGKASLSASAGKGKAEIRHPPPELTRRLVQWCMNHESINTGSAKIVTRIRPVYLACTSIYSVVAAVVQYVATPCPELWLL